MSEAQLGTIEPRGRAAGEGSEVPGPAHDVGSLGVRGDSDAGANVGRVPVGPAPGRAIWRWRSWPQGSPALAFGRTPAALQLNRGSVQHAVRGGRRQRHGEKHKRRTFSYQIV